MTHIRKISIRISQILQNIVSNKFEITGLDSTDTERKRVNNKIIGETSVMDRMIQTCVVNGP